MTRRRDLQPDEASLWRRVARTTRAYKPLPSIATPAPAVEANPTHVVPTSPELPHLALKRAKSKARVAAAVVPQLAAKQIEHSVADVSNHKRVRRGKLAIDARIDLHGMRQVEAQAALLAVIARISAQNGRCILVVTGKGSPIDPGEDYITPQPGVIRRRLPEWLNGPGFRNYIAGYSPAHARDGGLGAFYVLLKAKRVK